MTGEMRVGLGSPMIKLGEMAELAGASDGADPALVTARMDRLRRAEATVTTTSPSRRGDLADREDWRRQDFFRDVGRPPTGPEIMGTPVPGCDACGRLNGTSPCDVHVRQPGAPIVYPAHPWPSEQPGHYPGTARIASGPETYSVLNSVR